MKNLRSSIQIAAAMLIVAGLAFTNNLSVASRSTITQETSPEELAKKSGCLECHSVDKKITGPAYKDVAARYKDDSKARTTLIEKVKNGGKGNWTEITRGVPMPPHSKLLSNADIERLVDWVLSLDHQ